MHTFASSFEAHESQIALLVIGCFSEVFLVWFLVAIVRDERRMRVRRSPASRKRSYQLRLAIHSQKVGRARVRLTRIPGDRFGSGSLKLLWLIAGILLSTSVRLCAQSTNRTQTTPPPPSPLSTPAIAGPLQAAAPIEFDAGPLGKLDLDGIVSGMGLVQGKHVAGDSVAQAALTNGQVWIQKTTGWWQFYVQAGAYNILALGTPFLPTDKALTDLYGPVPVAFVKLVPGKRTSILVGALPTLMGAEYTFDFENMNIERGLLWNQENAVNRGVQLNQTVGKFTASISWNDGYYSN